jgi:hypothetical protein
MPIRATGPNLFYPYSEHFSDIFFCIPTPWLSTRWRTYTGVETY